MIFALAPVFAAHGEETVEVVECRDDEDDAATVERALPAGEDHLRARARGGVGMIAPIYLELGDTPGNTPETPPEHREAARDTLELLLGGWERAVQEADSGTATGKPSPRPPRGSGTACRTTRPPTT